MEGLGNGLAHVKVLKCVFVGFEHNGDYCALDAFDLQDFLMQDIAELFYTRSRNYRNNVTFTFHIVNLLDVFDLFEGIYNFSLLSRIDKNVDRCLKPTVNIIGLHIGH